MTGPVTSSPFFSLDAPVQKMILSLLPLQSLDNVSLICKQFLPISQDLIFSEALESIKLLKDSSISDYACKILLKNSKNKNLTFDHFVELIQAIKCPLLKFSMFISHAPLHPPFAKMAEDMVSLLKKGKQKYDAYLKLFTITKNQEHFSHAFPTAEIHSKEGSCFISRIKAYKVLKKLNSDLIDQNTIQTDLERMKTFNFISTGIEVKIILKCAQLSLNPMKDLQQARKVNQTLGHNLKYCVKLLQTYLEIVPSSHLEDATAKELLEDILNSPKKYLHFYTNEIVHKNVNLARLLAAKIIDGDDQMRVYLAILNVTKDIEDLKKILTISKCCFEDAVDKAISMFNDIDLARQLALRIRETYDAFRVFVKIYQHFKDPKDLQQAESFVQLIEREDLKIKVYRILHEITKNEHYFQLGMTLAQNELAKENYSAGYRAVIMAQQAVLTENPELLDAAFELVKDKEMFDPQLRIINLCIDQFKDFDRARKYVKRVKNAIIKKKALHKLASESRDLQDFQNADAENRDMKDQIQFRNLFNKIVPKFILEKNFEAALEFDKYFVQADADYDYELESDNESDSY